MALLCNDASAAYLQPRTFMRFISTNSSAPPAGFREALFSGLAPDGGLYVPEAIPSLPDNFIETHAADPLPAVGTEILSHYIKDIPSTQIHDLITRALDFPIPVVRLDEGISLLELFHGPTLAFKDVGARFMAQAMSHYLAGEERELTIVVATSGDTGSAVAHGFFNVPHISVFILYPSGKISSLQEQQMTTLGGNIAAVEVDGTFDDCQRLVKAVLNDTDVQTRRPLTTANSINPGRLLPQIVYYAWGLIQLHNEGNTPEAPLVVVPSGNFGNLTAAAYAKRMGLPIRGFVAATNANDAVLQYLHDGKFTPRQGIQTLSNAMDVGNPSNLTRLQALYMNNMQSLRENIDAVSIGDEETLLSITDAYTCCNYIADPHTAVGLAAARKAQAWTTTPPPVLVAATAHPAKFPEVVRMAIGREIPLPPALAEAAERPKHAIKIKGTYSEWKELLLG